MKILMVYIHQIKFYNYEKKNIPKNVFNDRIL